MKPMSTETPLLADSHRQPTVGNTLCMEWHGHTQREAMIAHWSRLEQQVSMPPMATATWVDCWLDHYGTSIPHWFVTGKNSQQEVVGVCLVTEGVGQRNGPCPVRTLHVGTAGEPADDSVVVEYNDWPVLPEWRARFVRALQAEIDRRPGWEEWNLDGFAIDSAFDGMWPPFHERLVTCCYFDLKRVREEKLQVLDRIGFATRKTIKNNIKTFKDLKVEWVTDDITHAQDIFQEMVDLHQARWEAEGRPGSYSSRVFREFHTDLINRFIPEGRVALFRVRDGQQTIGCSQLMLHGDHVMVYQGGRPNLASKFSPGLVTDYLCIEAAFERGFNIYDFLGGDTLHKRRLTTDTTSLVWRTWRRPSAKFFVLDCGRGVNAMRRAAVKYLKEVSMASRDKARRLVQSIYDSVHLRKKEGAR